MAGRRPTTRLRIESLEPRDVPATFTVTSLLDDGSVGTLRWAIDQANAAAGDDTVAFQAGLTGTITLNGTELTVNDPSGGKATIAGPGASALSVSGNNASRVFYLASATALSDLTVTNGRATSNPIPDFTVLSGGGFFVGLGVVVSLTKVTVANNSAGNGGGIFNNSGLITITQSTVTGNSAEADGGGEYNNGGTLTVNQSTLAGNTALVRGGGVFSAGSGQLTITGSTFTGNSVNSIGADSFGGGLYRSSGQLSITGSTFSNNSAGPNGRGGGVYSGGSYLPFNTLTISQTTFTNNSAGLDGGGVYATDEYLMTITGGAFTGNTAARGGGVFNASPVYLTGTTVSGNTAANGGGLYSTQSTELTDCTLTGNTATNGGGSYCEISYVRLIRCVVSSNTASNGGGAYNTNSGYLSVIAGAFSNNSADQNGGGVYSTTTNSMDFTDCSVAGNSAGLNGGGVYHAGPSPVYFTRCTLTGNSAAGGGGGVYVGNLGTANIATSTLAGNTAATGGAVYSAGVVTVRFSTLANNSVSLNGGGLYGSGASLLTMSQSTVAANAAGGGGGGVYTAGRVTITKSTLADNTAGDGGGVLNSGGVVRLKNALVVGNVAADVSGSWTDDGGNLVGVPAGYSLGQVVQVDAGGRPLLANNSGPTKTIALAANSPAVRRGVSAFDVTTDQRGLPLNPIQDAGAFETQVPTVTAAAPGGVYDGRPHPITSVTVTGLGGAVLGTSGSPTLSYRYYAGTLTADQLLTAVPLNGPPVFPGKYTAVVTYTNATAGYRDAVGTVRFTITAAPFPLAVSTPTPGGTVVKVLDPTTGLERWSVVPFPGFSGPLSVTTADVNADGVADVIVGAGPGGGPHVKAFDGASHAEIRSFFAFDPGFLGGLSVAAADVNADGFTDLVVGAGAGGGPHVKVFDGQSGQESRSFFAYAPDFLGGVNVAAGDLNADGYADLATGTMSGAPHVELFDGRTAVVLHSFYAYAPGFTGGVFVAVGGLVGDGQTVLFTGAGAGGGPHVEVFNGKTGEPVRDFFPFPPGDLGGVRVAARDVNGDGRADLVVASGPGDGQQVRALNGIGGAELWSAFPFDTSLTGGVFVG